MGLGSYQVLPESLGRDIRSMGERGDPLDMTLQYDSVPTIGRTPLLAARIVTRQKEKLVLCRAKRMAYSRSVNWILGFLR